MILQNFAYFKHKNNLKKLVRSASLQFKSNFKIFIQIMPL